MFKLTDRDKKMLLILSIFVIALVFYYTYQFTSGKIDTLKEENSQKLARLDELNRAAEIYNKNKDKIDETKLNYFDISQKLANNLDEKFCVVDALNLLKKYDATINDLPISAKQEYKYNDNNKKIDGAFFHSLKISTQLSYENLKKLFTETKDFNTLYSVDNLSIVPLNNGDMVSTSFELKFFGFKDEKAPVRQWQDFNLQTGKDNIFVQNGAKVIDENKTTNEFIEKNKDFLVTVSTLNSPTSSIVLEKSGEGIDVLAQNKEIEKAYIELKQNGDKLYYNMATEGGSYPKGGTTKEFKTNSDNIIIYVYSAKRKYLDDKNVVLLNIKNETKKRVFVYVFNDDNVLPRVNIIPQGTNIFVEKR